MEYDEAATKLLLVLNEVWEEVCGKTIDHDDSIPIVFPETGNTIRIAVPVGCFYPEIDQIYKVRMIENLLKQKLSKEAFWQIFDLIVDELLPMDACVMSFQESQNHLKLSKEQWRNQITKRIFDILTELNDQKQVLYTIPKYINNHTSSANRFFVSLEQTLLQLLR